MSYLRTKRIDFHALDKRTSKGDKAEIHGISVGQFKRIQGIIDEAMGDDSKLASSSAEANFEMVLASCHSLTLNGEKVGVTTESVDNLDALYYNILLSEVSGFHNLGETQKN